MHAQPIVQRFIEARLGSIHASRRRVLGAAVWAVMQGHALSLMRLARGVIGAGGLKASLKRIDRLIGHARIAREADEIAAALLGALCRGVQPLVIAVDWTAVAPGGQFAELRATVTRLGMGRALTIYQQVYPQAQQGSPRVERQLLERLRQWIAPGTAVIVVSDAGFRRAWFAHLERLGWGWIGRVRGSVCLAHGPGPWERAATWFTRATTRAQRWSECQLTRGRPLACEVVLVRKRPLGRVPYCRPGHGGNTRSQRKAQRRGREPWLLAHSVRLHQYRPEQIVALYAQRMQIEECFRDSKCAQLGMGLELSRSRSAQRLHALLLIGTLAAYLLWHIGQLAEAEGLHRRFKATTRHRREISLLTLGLLLCAMPQIPLSDHAQSALAQRLGFRS